MLEVDLVVNLEVVAAVVIPAIAAAYFLIKHAWHRSKTIDIMSTRIGTLEKVADESQNDHDKLFKEIGKLEKQIVAIETKINILLEKKQVS